MLPKINKITCCARLSPMLVFFSRKVLKINILFPALQSDTNYATCATKNILAVNFIFKIKVGLVPVLPVDHLADLVKGYSRSVWHILVNIQFKDTRFLRILNNVLSYAWVPVLLVYRILAPMVQSFIEISIPQFIERRKLPIVIEPQLEVIGIKISGPRFE